MNHRADQSARPPVRELWWQCLRNFVATPDQVAYARQFVRGLLEDSPLADDATMLISELATNAVLHSDSREPGGLFIVSAEMYHGDYFWAEVIDFGGPWKPRGVRDDDEREGGHGLEIVKGMATEWGRDGDAETGWVVWFRLDCPKP